MPPRRSTAGDTQAATLQLRTADQAARAAKSSRARVSNAGQLTVPLVHKHANGTESGHEFRLGHSPSIMALMEWGASTGGESLVAAFNVLKDLVHEDDWDEFRVYARENNIGAGEFGDFINAATEALAGRPTEAASGSSAG
jgi:hypothetical protein